MSLLVGMLLASIRWFGEMRQLSYRIPGPPVWLLVGFFAALVWLMAAARSAAVLRRDRKTRRRLPPPPRTAEWTGMIALAALSILVATHPFRADLNKGLLEVTVLDVGQGDSIFAAFPDGRTMLIDGGGLAGAEWYGGYRTGIDVGEEVVSPYLWSRGLKKLDILALTHAHHDHLDGLRAVLANFHVAQLWVGRDEETPAYEGLLAQARARGVSISHEFAGSKFDWDAIEGRVLWPQDPSATSTASNNNSLVLRLTDGKITFLLPGDIEQKVEAELVHQGESLTADFLKVPHHGSKTSSTEAFLDAVAPKVAVISVGEANPFGQPFPDVVERYQAWGARLFRTDRDGAVTARTDGQTLSIHTYVETNSR
ncbi:MAG: ComEC/Rec2 family competence protein [Candidatus Acidiferrales bacterium]